jgi:prepilin-type N-terminal cleavage/methylation domain-containing protein
MKNLKKGFTLIELLVVVAIIGILASVVLASLNTARAKGADAAIKANLANTRAQAALYYDAQTPTNTYAGVCLATTANNGISAGVAAATAVCNDALTGYAAEAPLKSVTGSYFCVDATGTAKTVTTALSGTTCPAS